MAQRKKRTHEKDYTPDGYIRTTFYLKKELKEQIKQEAIDQRRTITEVFNALIEKALRD